MPQSALIVVDVQNDFLPGGALPVPNGDAIIPVINGLFGLFPVAVGTRDGHPAGHCSFQSQGGPWPPHCVVGTLGSMAPYSLRAELLQRVFPKGTQVDRDSYSGFGNPELHEWLQKECVTRVVVCGLALDYCVKATALDAVARGYETWVVEDAAKPVTQDPVELARVREELQRGGVHFVLAQYVGSIV